MTATSTRRAAGAAAVPALSLSAIASEPDPIFAAIERHRLAEAAYERGAQEEMTEEAFEDLSDESHRQYIALLQTTPTTAAGCAAALLYMNQYSSKYTDGLFGNWGEDTQTAGNEWLKRAALVVQSDA